MKKIIALLTILFFASIAIAENEAIYDIETGLVEIPLLSIKGQEETISATLQQQDKEGLIFSVVDSISSPIVDSSINEVIYDPETGVVTIPTLFVLEKGGAVSKSYSVELQETEELIFEVTQMKNISAEQGSELASKKKQRSTAMRWCTGKPDQYLLSAKHNFESKCQAEYNDQLGHACEYKPDGYHCHGMVSIRSITRPDAPQITRAFWVDNHIRITGNQYDRSNVTGFNIYLNGRYFRHDIGFIAPPAHLLFFIRRKDIPSGLLRPGINLFNLTAVRTVNGVKYYSEKSKNIYLVGP